MSSRTLHSALGLLAIVASQALYPRVEGWLHRWRRTWLALASGVAVGYVFLFLLPKIGDYTAAIIREEPGRWEFAQYRLYGFDPARHAPLLRARAER